MAGNHGRPRRVRLAYGRIDARSAVPELGEVFLLAYASVPPGAVDDDFVHVGPDHHGRVVVALVHHLLDHVHAVVREFIAAADAVHYGNLHAGNYAQAVACGGNYGILRVVSDAEEVASHLLQEPHVTQMHLVRKGVGPVLEILMPVRSHELEMPAVEEESLLRVEAESPDSEAAALLVDYVSVPVQQPGYKGVELRRIHVPELGIGDAQILRANRFLVALAESRLHRGHLPPSGGDDALLKGEVLCLRGDVQMRLHAGFRQIVAHLRSADVNPVAAIMA